MDNPPISTTSPETVTVDTGADKESVQSLRESFDDFWKEQDATSSEGTAQAAPEPPPAAPSESKPEPSEPKQLETKPAETKPLEPAGPSEDEIDRFELRDPHARPEIQDQFRQLKDIAKAGRTRTQALAAEINKLSAELTEARANQFTPELKTDYENLLAHRRRWDFASDPEFQQKFQAPIAEHYTRLLDEVAEVLPNPEAGRQWAAVVKQYSPEGLSKQWWQESVLDRIPRELDRAAARDAVNDLLKMQRERDSELLKRTSDKGSFDGWVQEKTQRTQQRVQEEIMAEIGVQEKVIQEVLPRDASLAKTNEERVAIEKHNEKFNEINTYFQNCMKDISANGPRAWVRASIQATRAQMLWENNQSLVKELEGIRNERDQLKKELEKIQGVRKRMANTTGTPITSTDQKKNGSGLSIKDLDVRKAFDSYDWGERT